MGESQLRINGTFKIFRTLFLNKSLDIGFKNTKKCFPSPCWASDLVVVVNLRSVNNVKSYASWSMAPFRFNLGRMIYRGRSNKDMLLLALHVRW